MFVIFIFTAILYSKMLEMRVPRELWTWVRPWMMEDLASSDLSSDAFGGQEGNAHVWMGPARNHGMNVHLEPFQYRILNIMPIEWKRSAIENGPSVRDNA